MADSDAAARGPQGGPAVIGIVALMAVLVGGGLWVAQRNSGGDDPAPTPASTATSVTSDATQPPGGIQPSDDLSDLPTIDPSDFPTSAPPTTAPVPPVMSELIPSEFTNLPSELTQMPTFAP